MSNSSVDSLLQRILASSTGKRSPAEPSWGRRRHERLSEIEFHELGPEGPSPAEPEPPQDRTFERLMFRAALELAIARSARWVSEARPDFGRRNAPLTS